MTEPGPNLDLTDAAERFRIRAGDIGNVVARARYRTRTRRRAVSVLAAVAVVAAVPVAQHAMTPSADDIPVAASGGAVYRESFGMTWRRVEPKSALGFAHGTSTRGPLYGISSAPGERRVDDRQTSRVVWRSEDGVEWTPVSTLGPDLYLTDLSASDGRIYAVGTSPAEAVPDQTEQKAPLLRSTDVVVGWSDDDARTWHTQKLPFDGDGRGTRAGGVAMTRVATGAKGVVAVVVRWAHLDVAPLLPDGATAPHGWATTATGVDILGPERGDVCPAGYSSDNDEANRTATAGEVAPTWCSKGEDEDEEPITISPQQARTVTASYTWEQLGVKGDLLDAVLRRPVAFFAPPGSTEFSRVELPELRYAAAGTVAVAAHDDGFDLVASASSRADSGPDEVVVLRSPDGRSWAKATVSQGGRWTSAIGSLAGRTAFVTSGDDGGSLVSADGNGGWAVADLARAVSDDAATGRTLSVGNVAFGDFGVAVHVVLVPPDGRVQKGDILHRVLLSRDGATWDDVSVEEIVGTDDAGVTRLTITGDDVVVTASVPDPAKKDARRQVVVVGTTA